MLSFFRALWFVHGVIAFALIVLLNFPFWVVCTLVGSIRAERLAIGWAQRVVVPSMLFLFGVRLRVSGREHLEKGKTYIFASNHSTAIDILVNMASTPQIFKFLAKKEVERVPLIGYLARHWCVTVDRTDGSSQRESYEGMKAELNKGFSVFVYPEGTRNRTTRPLKAMFDGAFRLAYETQLPLVPITIIGSNAINPVDKPFYLATGVIQVIINAPISEHIQTASDSPPLTEAATIKMLKERLRAIIVGNITKYSHEQK